jgi:hypothetical protein
MGQIILHSLITTKGDWTIRIDSPHGDKDYHHKHVHVSKKRLNGEYSWNVDCSRHDEHKFPSSEQCIKKARKLAEDALCLPRGVLTLVTINEGKVWYSVETTNKNDNDLFRTYIRKNKVIVVLLSPKGLISVIIPHVDES